MIHRWWHTFIRRRTKPIPVDLAVKWKQRLSFIYGFAAWNALGLVMYSVYQGKVDWAHYYGLKTDEEKNMRPGQAWANTLGIKNAKVYSISGFTKVGEYEIVEGNIAETTKEETTDREQLTE